ncbi:MAG: class E sortase [Acidimicrobiales bacterium]|nr:class E sortase [Acidimicrobiales bacterium]
MRLAKLLGGVGRLLIWTGVIILLFVAYQLWGTNLAEARAQNDLESDFETLLESDRTTSSTPPPETTSDPTTTTTTITTTLPELPPIEQGEPLARLEMPAIGVDKIVVEGTSRDDLRKGPGHYPETPAPGQSGNAAIAGHRTTYGAPFHRVDELAEGDEIVVTTPQGEFTYEVMGQEIVSPTDVGVLEDKGDDRLTLTSCHPKYSARERIIITASLAEDEEPAAPTTRPPREGSTDETIETVETIETIDGAEQGSLTPVIIFGLIALAIWLVFYALSRKWRRWPSYLLGVVPFGLALFVWFGAVADLLPSNF